MPPTELLKLLSSSSSEVRRLAALNLGHSGSVADIKSIQDFMDKSGPPAGTASGVVTGSKPIDGDPLYYDLQITIARIRLREQLATASGEARQELIKKGLADPALAEWAWYRFVRQNSDGERPAAEPRSQTARQLKVLPLGENIFPREVTYFAALPKPRAALDKFSNALAGLQLESVRSQASLVLVLSALRICKRTAKLRLTINR